MSMNITMNMFIVMIMNMDCDTDQDREGYRRQERGMKRDRGKDTDRDTDMDRDRLIPECRTVRHSDSPVLRMKKPTMTEPTGIGPSKHSPAFFWVSYRTYNQF
jgi:hypothetical protein